MIHNVKILFFICFFTACSSTEQKEIVTAGELLRQAAFYGERLQFLPALETYQQAIKLAEKEKDSTVFSLAYLEMGKIYRYQSLKQKALQSEKSSKFNSVPFFTSSTNSKELARTWLQI